MSTERNPRGRKCGESPRHESFLTVNKQKKESQMKEKWIGKTLEIKWGTSRGRDSYGYTTCTLRSDGVKIAGCNGGGYDMLGTVIGNWATCALCEELLVLKPRQMPAQSHWEPARARQCDGVCKDNMRKAVMDAVVAGGTGDGIELAKLPEDCYECPTCKGHTIQGRDGKRIDDGRYFYGLTFHDPNYDPGKAVIGKDCSDRTLTKGDKGSKGKTVADAEKAGNSFGLERLQAAYKASEKHATKRHTEPSIDGACGILSVMDIIQACGVTLEKVHDSAKLDIYVVRGNKKKESNK